MKLETERLILREWRDGDVEDLISGLNNLNISQWLVSVPYPYTKKDAENWMRYCRTLQGQQQNAYEFAIELKSEKKVIGGTTLNKINRFHGTAGGGIWINETYHGMGYGSEAFAERIRFAFMDLHLRKLENGFLEGNPSSQYMQARFGYKIEGKRRKAYRCMADGEIKDELLTGLLREEWRQK